MKITLTDKNGNPIPHLFAGGADLTPGRLRGGTLKELNFWEECVPSPLMLSGLSVRAEDPYYVRIGPDRGPLLTYATAYQPELKESFTSRVLSTKVDGATFAAGGLHARLTAAAAQQVRTVDVRYLPDGYGYGHEEAVIVGFYHGYDRFQAVLDLQDWGLEEAFRTEAPRGEGRAPWNSMRPDAILSGTWAYLPDSHSEKDWYLAMYARMPMAALRAALDVGREAYDKGDDRPFILRAESDWQPDSPPQESPMGWLPHGFSTLSFTDEGLAVTERTGQVTLYPNED